MTDYREEMLKMARAMSKFPIDGESIDSADDVVWQMKDTGLTTKDGQKIVRPIMDTEMSPLPSSIDASLAITIPDLLQHQLPDIPLLNGCSVICDKDNVGQIWFGGSSVAVGLAGVPIDAGESLPFPYDNTEAIYYIAEVATDTFYVIGG